MVQYLLESSNLKLEVTDVDFSEALNALSPEKKKALETKFSKYDNNKDRSKTLSKNGDEQEGVKERVNALMVVATLIAGIAFQAAMNPPGGVWQDDSKVNSGTDPFKFAYYLDHMFRSSMTGSLQAYIDFNLPNSLSFGNGGAKGRRSSDIRDFVTNLYSTWDEVFHNMTYHGLILQDTNFTDVVSNYNKSGNISKGGSFPYLIRYAGYPILGYTYPTNYVIYIVTNGVALFVSLTIIALVVCGFMIKISVTQVRVISVLMCISIGCIATGYLSILVAMLPGFYVQEKVEFIILQVFFGVCCILGIGSFIWTLVWQIVKLRKRKRHLHNIGITDYFKEVFDSMDATAAGKLIFFIVGYSALHYNGFIVFGLWSQLASSCIDEPDSCLE